MARPNAGANAAAARSTASVEGASIEPSSRAIDVDATPVELRRRGEHMSFICIAAQRQNRPVLEEEQLIADLVRGALFGEAVLEIPGFPVPDPSQPRNGDRTGGASGWLDTLRAQG